MNKYVCGIIKNNSTGFVIRKGNTVSHMLSLLFLLWLGTSCQYIIRKQKTAIPAPNIPRWVLKIGGNSGQETCAWKEPTAGWLKPASLLLLNCSNPDDIPHPEIFWITNFTGGITPAEEKGGKEGGMHSPKSLRNNHPSKACHSNSGFVIFKQLFPYKIKLWHYPSAVRVIESLTSEMSGNLV